MVTKIFSQSTGHIFSSVHDLIPFQITRNLRPDPIRSNLSRDDTGENNNNTPNSKSSLILCIDDQNGDDNQGTSGKHHAKSKSVLELRDVVAIEDVGREYEKQIPMPVFTTESLAEPGAETRKNVEAAVDAEPPCSEIATARSQTGGTAAPPVPAASVAKPNLTNSVAKQKLEHKSGSEKHISPSALPIQTVTSSLKAACYDPKRQLMILLPPRCDMKIGPKYRGKNITVAVRRTMDTMKQRKSSSTHRGIIGGVARQPRKESLITELKRRNRQSKTTERRLKMEFFRLKRLLTKSSGKCAVDRWTIPTTISRI